MNTALITGASRRIGAAIARTLASNGWQVILQSRAMNPDLKSLMAEIESKGGKAKAVFSDLMDENAVADLIDSAKSAAGNTPIRLLVNNASVFDNDDINSASWAQFDKHMAIHVKTPMTLAQKFSTQKNLSDGLIVNIIDQRVWRLNPSFMTYTLSKSALWTLTQTLAQALAPAIRVNAIGPGPTLANDYQGADDFTREAENVLLERATDPIDIANAVCFLWQSKSMTGQMMALDGGQHLAWKTPDVLTGGAGDS